MEAAYDHIQEEAIPKKEDATAGGTKPASKEEPGNLNTDFQEAYRAFSASPWGARIGGFLASARKQGETYIQEGRAQATTVGGEAFRGFSDLGASLVSRARSMSSGEADPSNSSSSSSGATESSTDTTGSTATVTGKEKDVEGKGKEAEGVGADADNPEAPGFISRFRNEAEKRLKDIQKAEDAADEALLRFGSNIRNFLRDAVTIAPPAEGEDPDAKGKVLFESKDHEGKRVIHTTRFDAQLHVIHCSVDSFMKDPASPEWEKWKDDFDVGKKTDDIAKDLEKYEELRKSMEKVVPEKVDYDTFWKRYYFLRMVIESEEKRRKEILKGAAQDEVVGWDEDSDDEPSTPHAKGSIADLKSDVETLKPNEHRKSEDKTSQAGSDASYDLVSGTQSRAPGSPKEEKSKKKDDSEDDDWE